MAKLRVGDIEIDGSNVRIHRTGDSPGVTAISQTPSPPVAQTAPTQRGLADIPGAASTYMAVGGLLAGLGVALITLLGVSGASDFLLHGGVLLPGGLGLFLLGVLLSRSRATKAQEDAAKQRQTAVEFAETIMGELSDPDERVSIEELTKRIPLTETELLRGMQHLIDQKLLQEDLDLDTGDWSYRRAETAEPEPSGSVAERLSALEDKKESK